MGNIDNHNNNRTITSPLAHAHRVTYPTCCTSAVYTVGAVSFPGPTVDDLYLLIVYTSREHMACSRVA